ncbi:hypothetical protein COCSUDRAFT_32470 [Coccomyxa subellipsoidea C-169]|uniref:Uncharacterized protein n=1 Tax=Coccomyxa subellipsoidea (strain C-169) TaxID=574566 RepID=I0Z5Y0_COCSC|nr:hypothetical protein COCSUDRAFT_32470 [Coccomyxa subellipsoidea C-169]EIE26049.1 hypothetical protein COCSUDRAFT_32470 [Coccomyxa subellipsoidea C-169]|eukprot:XP_005650593.1 hypothetical protein COCSUDRAFT_32470 [Coccomyxa subellipsoidea C-169]
MTGRTLRLQVTVCTSLFSRVKFNMYTPVLKFQSNPDHGLTDFSPCLMDIRKTGNGVLWQCVVTLYKCGVQNGAVQGSVLHADSTAAEVACAALAAAAVRAA